MNYRAKIAFLEQSADELSEYLRTSRLHAMDYAPIVETIINIYEQIRKFQIAERYQKTTVSSDDR